MGQKFSQLKFSSFVGLFFFACAGVMASAPPPPAGLEADCVSTMDSVDQEYLQTMKEEPLQTPCKKRKQTEEPASGEKTGRARVGNGKAKAKPKAVKRTIVKKCRGCRKKVEPSEVALNWPGCITCKRALDNITKMAARQGAERAAYVSKARQDEDQCYHMIQSYLEVCPESLDGGACGRKRGQWCVVKYIERVKAATGMVRDRCGEMQWEKLYLEFAQTTRGGKLREEEASAKWLEWKDKVALKDPSVLYDYDGPNGQLRIWVHTGDTLNFRSSYMQEKEVEMEGCSKKRATQDDVDKMAKEVVRGHGQVDYGNVAQALTVSGYDAFAKSDGLLGSVAGPLDFYIPSETFLWKVVSHAFLEASPKHTQLAQPSMVWIHCLLSSFFVSMW